MSLITLVTYIAIAALILTGILKIRTNKISNFTFSFLQNFTGILFLFSGWVKVVDPMGTAFKMEQYFAEFEATFSETWLSFIAPLFPALSEYSIAFSVFMIILEMVLGLFLVLGILPRITAWLFFLIILFFTFLTGFTYLTGYVPQDVNFFEFSKWESFVKTNMKVTDCGCFGDFIKLEPKTSFLKDIFLLIPAILFLIRSRNFHVLVSKKASAMIGIVSTFLLFVYALYNFYWNEPHVDFRPFREGVNIREQKEVEKTAMANVEITIVMKNKADGQVVKLPYEQWMKAFKDYPKDEWEYLEQEKSEPSVPQTKISEFMVEDMDGEEVGDAILAYEDYLFIVICHKFKGDMRMVNVEKIDTIFRVDSVMTEGGTLELANVIDRIDTSEEYVYEFNWNPNYIKWMQDKIAPLALAATKDEIQVIGIVGGAVNDAIVDMQSSTGLEFPFYKADDILLKTIQRSNPGVVLMKDGKIIRKWHIRQLPDYETIKSKYLK